MKKSYVSLLGVLSLFILFAGCNSGEMDGQFKPTGNFLEVGSDRASLLKSKFKWEYGLEKVNITLDIYNASGQKVSSSYHFEANTSDVQPFQDSKETKRTKMVYSLKNVGCTNDFEVMGDITVVELTYTKKEHGFLNTYRKRASKITLYGVSIESNGGLDSKKFMGEYVSDDDADKELIDSIPVPQELRASPLLPSNPVDSQGRPNPKNYKE